MIPFRRHDHLIQNDMCKDRLEEIKALIEMRSIACHLTQRILQLDCLHLVIFYSNTYSIRMAMTLMSFEKKTIEQGNGQLCTLVFS